VRYAILGGSFNPIHVGHLFLADAVLTGFDYDRVILIPAFQSPFKIGAEAASPQDRMEMLAASVPGEPRLTIDDCEIRRQGVSFTVETLTDIISRYKPEGKPGLILGDDLASTFDKWRRPEEIAELADIIIAKRLSDPESSPLVNFHYPHRTLSNEIINISSQEIREKILRGENWRYLVPSGARYIIEDRKLYGFSGAGTPPELPLAPLRPGDTPAEAVPAALTAASDIPGNVLGVSPGRGRGNMGLTETIVCVENEVRIILSPSRFIHSRSTALMAWDLCRRFGLDCHKGYLAGIAHDMCKSLGEEELIRLAHADGGGLSKLERGKPGLLHARAAAVLLQKKYGIEDRDILEAIRCHTTGKRDMGSLAKTVYIADKIEVSRSGTDPALIKMSRNADLDTLFKAVLDYTVAYLRSREVDLSYGTRRLLAAMKKRNYNP